MAFQSKADRSPLMISSEKVQLRPVSEYRWRGWETLSCCGWLKQGGRGWFQVVRFQDGFSLFSCIWGKHRL